MVWLDLETAGGDTSCNLVLFARPKHMELEDPAFTHVVDERPDGEFILRLSAASVALWAWFELDGAGARFSDNFIHVRPGRTSEIAIRPDEALGLEDVRERLTIQSLFNTY